VASGVIGAVAAEAVLVPTKLVAVTVQVYATSLVSPETGIVVVGLVASMALLPSEQTAPYDVMVEPPSDPTATCSVISLSSAVTDVIVGAIGTVAATLPLTEINKGSPSEGTLTLPEKVDPDTSVVVLTTILPQRL